MTRPTIGLLLALNLGLLVAPLAPDAQQSTKVFRIGVLASGSPPSGPSPASEVFRQGLRDLGYVEGQNLITEHRYAERSDERARDLAAELVRLEVDVMVAFGGPASRGATKATSAIPIVMSVGDALEQGLVPGLARPGGNVTGISFMAPETSQRRLELLREALPQLARVAVLWCPDLAGNPPQWREVQVSASRLGLQLQSLEVRSPDDFEPAFAAATRDGAEALFVANCALFPRERIVALAGKHRLPAIYPARSYMVAGGLMAYGANELERVQRVVVYVGKILQGAKPADLPVEQSMQFELVINLKTAEALGLTIPPFVLFQATEVIR
jgi:putative ABC transport system substrate-binding protein